FGVHTRGGNVCGGEAGDGRGERVFQLHTAISPQREISGAEARIVRRLNGATEQAAEKVD
ncbi:MAG TPA: hypothetical protein VNS62_15350, partial [Candidatus Udaeobacter sp.]|nr:hypothetical protein [Candidatus Udaeobacter sp.]